MPTPTVYPLAAHSWQDNAVISIKSLSGQNIAFFPLSFVAYGGDNTWEYVSEVVRQLVEQSGIIAQMPTGIPVDSRAAPTPGSFVYMVAADLSKSSICLDGAE
jgi:hypothetical protein